MILSSEVINSISVVLKVEFFSVRPFVIWVQREKTKELYTLTVIKSNIVSFAALEISDIVVFSKGAMVKIPLPVLQS